MSKVAEMGRLPKPVMRGLLTINIKKHMVGLVVVSVVTAAAMQLLYCGPRKQAYADFYKTYDPEAALKIMEDAGLMQSCPK